MRGVRVCVVNMNGKATIAVDLVSWRSICCYEYLVSRGEGGGQYFA